MTSRSVILIVFWSLVIAATVFFVASQFRYSASKPMWLDEVYGLHYSTRGPTVEFLVVNGAPGQGSPAPLDYLFLKGLDAIRHQVQFLGMHPHAYFRLSSLLACVLAGLAMVAVASKNLSDNLVDRALQSILILFALLLFWIGPWTYRYAGEMRPYALWNSLWFVSLLLFFKFPLPKKCLSFVLTLLGLTAVASCYQLAALGIGYGLSQLWSGQGWRAVVKDMLVIFSVPSSVCLYYIFKVSSWNYIGLQWGTWDAFWSFYSTHMQVFLYCIAGTLLCFLNRQTRSYMVPAFAMSILFMMGPLIYWLTRSRGFFFSERQFIYYSTAAPIFFLSISACLPVWREKFAGRYQVLVWVTSLALVGGLSIDQLYERLGSAKYQLTLDTSWNVPADPKDLLGNLLSRELPIGFCVEGAFTSASQGNLELIAEWIPIHFSNLPKGHQIVHVKTMNNENMEVLSVSSQTCESGYFMGIGSKPYSKN